MHRKRSHHLTIYSRQFWPNSDFEEACVSCEELDCEQDEGKRMVTINMCLGRPHKDCIDRALCKLQVSCQVATKVFHSKFSLTF